MEINILNNACYWKVRTVVTVNGLTGSSTLNWTVCQGL
jgi:hypothetical protein